MREGVKIEEYYWTFNMPTDHARVSFKDVWVPDRRVFGPVDNGLVLARHFVHENRIRQAASGVGAAQYCINESIDYANSRKPFGKPLVAQPGDPVAAGRVADRSGDGALADLPHGLGDGPHDRAGDPALSLRQGVDVQLPGNRLVCNAADQAMQAHGGMGYSRHKQFEHIYRHHRRYRITEGSEEIQMRNVGGHMFGFIGKNRPEVVECGKILVESRIELRRAALKPPQAAQVLHLKPDGSCAPRAHGIRDHNMQALGLVWGEVDGAAPDYRERLRTSGRTQTSRRATCCAMSGSGVGLRTALSSAVIFRRVR